MKKGVAILGSTGSIGTQAIEVIRANRELFDIKLLSSAGNTIDAFVSQIIEFKPRFVFIGQENYENVKHRIIDAVDYKVDVLVGSQENYRYIAQGIQIDILVAAISGFAGVLPTIMLAKCSKILAIANKETILYANHLINEIKLDNELQIIPIDSEHNSLYSLIQGKPIDQIKKYYLIASGGPFFKYDGDFSKITPQMALKHPKWNMGKKNSIDSATLVNKGIELIEAVKLFDISVDNITTLIHPQVIFHGMVTMVDNSTHCFLSNNDMKLHISSSILPNYSKVREFVSEVDFTKIGALEFYEIDDRKFPAFSLARQAISGGNELAVISYNSADEILVDAFLKGAITFDAISYYLHKVVEHFAKINIRNSLSYQEILQYHCEVQNFTNLLLANI